MISAILHWFLWYWLYNCLIGFIMLAVDFLIRRSPQGRRRASRKPPEAGFWSSFLWLAAMPLTVAALLLGALVSVPYFWLYPERHAVGIDFGENEEQKRVLAEYRYILSRKPLWRRLAEKLKLAQNTDPKWPWSDEGVV